MNKLSEVNAFLKVPTPPEWVSYALKHIDILLIDHAHCEKKAAGTALGLMYRYVDKPDLLHQMSRIAREELRHFEQVLAIMQNRGIVFQHLTASRYMTSLVAHIRTYEPEKLVDTLIIGALVEARSCERFAAIAVHLDDELQGFYTRLIRSESRHFISYLDMAKKWSAQSIDDRIEFFSAIENNLIISTDPLFRFHSGIPENH